MENVTVTGAIASICIKVSKTDPFRQGQTIRLAASGSSTCPVRSLQKHLNNCPNGKQPLFTFQDTTFLTRQTLSALVKQLLRTSELPGLSSHSFRIGAAKPAAAAKVPDWLIKTLGRWSSNCYEKYIRTPDNIIESIPSVLVNTVVRRSESWQPQKLWHSWGRILAVIFWRLDHPYGGQCFVQDAKIYILASLLPLLRLGYLTTATAGRTSRVGKWGQR